MACSIHISADVIHIYMIIYVNSKEMDVEQRTGSKLGKESVKAVYCHPAYLTYVQSTA